MLAGTHIVGANQPRLVNTLSVAFAGVEGEALLVGLDLEGICVSSGSACTSGSLEPSHVLTAMGIDAQLARGAVRFSLGRGNTEAEIDTTSRAVSTLLSRFRPA